MNRFFKVIWCEALNAYVVAGEFAKGHTKSASMRKLIAVLVAGGMLGTGFVNSVDAAASKGSQQITITDKDTTGATTEIKTIFYVESEWPTYPYAAGGYSSISSWSGHAANNYDKIVQAGTTWEGTNNISLGLFTNAGYALKENADGDYKILRGTNANPVYYHGQQINGSLGYDIDESKQYNYATAFGIRTAAANRLATAWGSYSVASGLASTAFGHRTIAKGECSIAWGEDTKASGELATSWGSEAVASGRGATAWGSETKASDQYATAWGYGSKATGYHSTAWGYRSEATGDQSTAFGKWSYANATNSLAVAGGEVDSDAKNGIAIGWYANSTIKDGIALGNGSVTTRTAGDTNAYGKGDSTGNAWVSTSVALAVGKDAEVTRQITGVAAGSKDTDAVNVAQLKQVASQAERAKITVSDGINTTVTSTVAEDGHTDYKVNLNKDLTGIESMTNGLSSIRMGNGGTVTINNRITIDQSGKISGVAAGEVKEGSTDAVNGSQLKGVENKADKNAENIQKNTDAIVKNTEAISKNTENIQKNSDAIAKNAENIQKNTDAIAKNTKAIAKNTEDISKNTEAIGKLDERVTSVEEVAKKHTTVSTDDKNVQISEDTNKDGGKDYKVSLNKDLNLSSVTTGDTKMDTNGVTVKDVSLTKDGLSIGNKTYVSNKGLNANDQKVTNVAAGDISEKSTDAVNGSQLFATNQQVVQNAQSISKLGNRINKVGAGAAALAALHPLDFDPDDKWDFAAGYGNYNGENAAAIGAYYRPNEDTMFSVGGSFGNGENMVNAGVSLKLGQGNHVSTSKVAMAKEIKDLRKELEGLKSALLDVNAGKKLDTSKLQLFPDVPKNHWAYEYVSTLKGNGALTGYPDGEFKGDRPMTRYEFATMLYKAMLEGATLSDRILKEFAPELERFTVDTVHQDKDGKPTVERVRTVKAEK